MGDTLNHTCCEDPYHLLHTSPDDIPWYAVISKINALSCFVFGTMFDTWQFHAASCLAFSQLWKLSSLCSRENYKVSWPRELSWWTHATVSIFSITPISLCFTTLVQRYFLWFQKQHTWQTSGDRRPKIPRLGRHWKNTQRNWLVFLWIYGLYMVYIWLVYG